MMIFFIAGLIPRQIAAASNQPVHFDPASILSITKSTRLFAALPPPYRSYRPAGIRRKPRRHSLSISMTPESINTFRAAFAWPWTVPSCSELIRMNRHIVGMSFDAQHLDDTDVFLDNGDDMLKTTWPSSRITASPELNKTTSRKRIDQHIVIPADGNLCF
jgi:hypothetical protein